MHLAFDTVAQKQVACKTIIARGKDRKDMQNLMKEVNILRGLQHVGASWADSSAMNLTSYQPNINRVLDVDTDEKHGWL